MALIFHLLALPIRLSGWRFGGGGGGGGEWRFGGQYEYRFSLKL